ncbi:hypothetical protein ACC687_38420, partial [Rhizobium ruizarguesonis]
LPGRPSLPSRGRARRRSPIPASPSVRGAAGQPLPIAGRKIFVTSQSGESAEVVRWFDETGGTEETFGLTLEGGSFLARTAPSLVGAGGTELA